MKWFNRVQPPKLSDREQELIDHEKWLEEMMVEHRRNAYEKVNTYVMEHMAAQVPLDYSNKKLAFVDPWLFDLYEIVTPPIRRFSDVKQSQNGYNNLLYKGIPVTYKTRNE